MLDFIETLLARAGELCRTGLKQDLFEDVDFKGQKDLVTVVDRGVENHIIKHIRSHYPEHDIIGEETGSHLTGSAYQWIIDPIDGTTSYFHRQPYFSVSIGVKKNGVPVYGGVYAPLLGQMFLAERGNGATLNGNAIKVSSSMKLVDSVLATGFACLRAELEHNNLVYFTRIVPHIRDIRRCGSAALDLAYVASGRYDGFWELNLNDYDIAAGVLLVQEAGGNVIDFTGGSQYPERGIIATNGRIDDELLALFPESTGR